MRFFAAHWKRYTRWTSLIFIAFAIGGGLALWQITGDSILDYGEQTLPIIFNGFYQYVVYGYFILIMIISATLEIGNVFSVPIKQDRMIQQITKKFWRNKVFFIKSSYLLLSLWWKIVFIGIIATLGIAIGSGFDPEMAGGLYHFIWASVGALFFLITGLSIIFMLGSLYIGNVNIQLLGWVIIAGFVAYIVILFLVQLSSVPLAVNPSGTEGNPSFFPSPGENAATWTDSQNAFLGTAWFNIPYQFMLIQYYFWGIAFTNPFQLQANLPMGFQFVGFLMLPKNYTFTDNGASSISAIFHGNLYTPLPVFIAWLLIPSFVYGMSYKAFSRKDFN